MIRDRTREIRIRRKIGDAREALHIEQDIGLVRDAVGHHDVRGDAGGRGVPGIEEELALVDVAVHRVEHAARAAHVIARAHEVRAAGRPRVVGSNAAIDQRCCFGERRRRNCHRWTEGVVGKRRGRARIRDVRIVGAALGTRVATRVRRRILRDVAERERTRDRHIIDRIGLRPRDRDRLRVGAGEGRIDLRRKRREARDCQVGAGWNMQVHDVHSRDVARGHVVLGDRDREWIVVVDQHGHLIRGNARAWEDHLGCAGVARVRGRSRLARATRRERDDRYPSHAATVLHRATVRAERDFCYGSRPLTPVIRNAPTYNLVKATSRVPFEWIANKRRATFRVNALFFVHRSCTVIRRL